MVAVSLKKKKTPEESHTPIHPNHHTENIPKAVPSNPIDIADNPKLERLRQHCVAQGIPFFEISAVTGKGIKEILRFLASKVREETPAAI